MGKRNSQAAALNQRLASYLSGARKLQGRLGNWPVYAAAAGSALAMTTNASASILYGVYTGGSGPNGGIAVQPQVDGASSAVALLFDAGKINLKAVSGSSSNGPFAQLSVEGVAPIQIFQAHAFPSSQNAKNFGAGVAISAGAGTLASHARIVGARFSGSDFGDFVDGQIGYVGFAYALGGGNFDYGWLKVDFVKVGDMPHILEALAWGIEQDPNHKIAAGDNGTPEPGTMAMGILAAGAAGVTALRRRRKQQ